MVAEAAGNQAEIIAFRSLTFRVIRGWVILNPTERWSR